MKSKRLFIYGGLTLAVAAGLIYGFLPQAVPVERVAVSRAQLEETVSEEGETRLRRRYRVTSPVQGQVARIDLDVGDRMQAGQAIATIRPPDSPLLDPRRRAEARAALEAATAALGRVEQELESARAGADLAEQDYGRIRELYLDGDASQAGLEQAETDRRRALAVRRAAEFSRDVARHEMDAARVVLDFGSENPQPVVVGAPIDGLLTRVYRESEGPVAAGEPLVELGDTASLEVQVDVLSSDAVRIAPEMPVRFLRWGGDAPLDGRVRRVEPVGFTKVSALGVEEQRVWVICDIVSRPEVWERLGDGYRVEAEFILWQQDDVLQVPTSALFRQQNQWAVFVVEDGVARLREVQPGRRSGLQVQVLSGLTPGEEVIAHPGDDVEDGRKVRDIVEND